MRSRKAANEHVAEVARRRLELLTAELAQVSRTQPDVSEETGELLVTPERGPASSPAHEVAPTPTEVAPCPPPPVGPGAAPPAAARSGRHARRPVALPARVLGWMHDRLPPTLQGRVQLGSSHLAVVALLVAAALAVTSWWVIRADGGGQVVPLSAATGRATELPVTSPTGSAAQSEPVGSTAPAAAGASSPTAGATIIVDVAGKVRRPGIATLPAGSRVVDALDAAGGPRRGVDLTTLNLARVLVDGEQVVVGVPPPSGVAAPAASAPDAAGAGPAGAGPGGLVNLNTATQTELETLPGVGPVTAAAILTWRTENGAFSAVDELLEVSGIGDATLAELAPFVTI